jgi:hypothetical protein
VSDSTGSGFGCTVMLPRPVRTPSVAVTVADFAGLTALDADAGVFAGSRVENDVPDTRTVTVTLVRFANRTQPPSVISTEDTSRLSPRPCAIVTALHEAAFAEIAVINAVPRSAATRTAMAVPARRLTPPWCQAKWLYPPVRARIGRISVGKATLLTPPSGRR